MDKWKQIRNTKYEISDKGQVRNSKTGKILKPSIKNSGYAEIVLSENGKTEYHLVHRLVAEAFIGPLNEKIEVNHIDENKLNNSADNLEYCTHKENINHGSGNVRRSISNSGQKRTAETCKNISEAQKKAVCMIDKITGERLRTFPSIIDAEAELGKRNANIGSVCNGKRKTALGYKWEFIPA